MEEVKKLRKERIPYQIEFSDGLKTNQFVKKPEAQGGVVYSIIDKETIDIHGEVFLPTWDSADHLHFACANCRSVADILEVQLSTSYSDEVKYALFFSLGCRGCGATGQRKIYLDRRAKACIFQQAFDNWSIYLYGRTKKPIKTINLREVVEQSRKGNEAPHG